VVEKITPWPRRFRNWNWASFPPFSPELASTLPSNRKMGFVPPRLPTRRGLSPRELASFRHFPSARRWPRPVPASPVPGPRPVAGPHPRPPVRQSSDSNWELNPKLASVSSFPSALIPRRPQMEPPTSRKSAPIHRGCPGCLGLVSPREQQAARRRRPRATPRAWGAPSHQKTSGSLKSPNPPGCGSRVVKISNRPGRPLRIWVRPHFHAAGRLGSSRGGEIPEAVPCSGKTTGSDRR